MAITYPFKFTYTEDIERFFYEKQIFLAHIQKISGVFKMGEQLTIPGKILVEPYSTMPARSFISSGAFSYCFSRLGPRVSVGRYCSIAVGCKIMGIDHPTSTISTHIFAFRPHFANAIKRDFGQAPEPVPFKDKPLLASIGNDVWIGQDVLIRQGVRIGDGAVIGGGSVVTRDVPAFAIVAGSPAQIIRYRFEDKVIDRIRSVAWWQYHVSDFHGLPVDDPLRFVNELQERAWRGEVMPYRPEIIDLAQAISEIVEKSRQAD
ncbi:CatB-related O-acetyltransferase [Azomonas agilis]|nr:CatB-related O-acetyltransferase [Azomonas agilis]